MNTYHKYSISLLQCVWLYLTLHQNVLYVTLSIFVLMPLTIKLNPLTSCFAHMCQIVLCVVYRAASESRVLTCAAVWRMPPEWETGSHESPDDSSNNPQTLELLCHLDNTAHGSVAWYAARYRLNPTASRLSLSLSLLHSFPILLLVILPLLLAFISITLFWALSLAAFCFTSSIQSILLFFSRCYRNLLQKRLYFTHQLVWFLPPPISFVSAARFISYTIIHNTEYKMCVLKDLGNGSPRTHICHTVWTIFRGQIVCLLLW